MKNDDTIHRSKGAATCHIQLMLNLGVIIQFRCRVSRKLQCPNKASADGCLSSQYHSHTDINLLTFISCTCTRRDIDH